ncbi:Retrovirus-related Pol polyprotein from transposon RE1 [Bienertia sinuspersici]
MLNKQQNSSPPPEPQANIAGICLVSSLHSSWIIDSGATDHICSNLDLFHSYVPYVGNCDTITIANGKRVKIQHIGMVFLDNGIVLKDVLHVCDFKYNLISTNKLCRDLGCSVTFTPTQCLLQDSS